MRGQSARDRGNRGLNVRSRQAADEAGELTIEITDPGEPGDDVFKLQVLQGGKVVETFDNVTTKRGPQNVATIVKQQSKLILIEEDEGWHPGRCRRRARSGWPLSSRRPFPR